VGRPKHQNKELERVLREAEEKGWRVEKRPNRYFKMKCPCDQQHMKAVKLSPSNPYYEKQLRGGTLPQDMLGRLREE
jgi:hypothetical protein